MESYGELGCFLKVFYKRRGCKKMWGVFLTGWFLKDVVGGYVLVLVGVFVTKAGVFL